MVMKQSKFNTEASHLTHNGKWDHRQGIGKVTILSLHQQKCYETLYSSQTRRDNFCCSQAWLIRCSVFHHPRLDDIFLQKISNVSFTLLPKQMLKLDEIFTTASSTTFVHKLRYSQHKMEVPQRGFEGLIHTSTYLFWLRLKMSWATSREVTWLLALIPSFPLC